jgi:hypothetical protein
VILSGAGNGPLVSHPRPPIINLANTHSLTVQDSIFADATGMVFQSPGTGTSTIRRSLISRVGIGAEFLSSGNTYLSRTRGGPRSVAARLSPLRYDGDGIHVDGANSKQTIKRSFMVDIGDDAIDHSNSTFTVEDTVIHDAGDKAISMTNGAATIRNSLIYRTGSGVRGSARVYNSTIVSSSPIATPQVLSDSIIWPNTLSSCAGDVHQLDSGHRLRSELRRGELLGRSECSSIPRSAITTWLSARLLLRQARSAAPSAGASKQRSPLARQPISRSDRASGVSHNVVILLMLSANHAFPHTSRNLNKEKSRRRYRCDFGYRL